MQSRWNVLSAWEIPLPKQAAMLCSSCNLQTDFRCNTHYKPQVKKEADDSNETQNKLSWVIMNIHESNQRHLSHHCLCVHPENAGDITRPEEQTAVVPNSDKLIHHLQFLLLAFSPSVIIV